MLTKPELFDIELIRALRSFYRMDKNKIPRYVRGRDAQSFGWMSRLIDQRQQAAQDEEDLMAGRAGRRPRFQAAVSTVLRCLLDPGPDRGESADRQRAPYLRDLSSLANDAVSERGIVQRESLVRIDYPDTPFQDTLTAAVYFGRSSMVRDLLERGADATATSSFFGRPLPAAAGKGHEDLVELLLDHHADPNAGNGDVRYGHALEAAARAGHASIVALLLDRGADVNAKNKDEYYAGPLAAAASAGHQKIVRLLLEPKYNLDGSEDTYDDAIRTAAYAGHELIVACLLQAANISQPNTLCEQLLETASGDGHLALVRWLVDKGTRVEPRHLPGSGAMHAAAAKGHCDVLRLLLATGAPPETDPTHPYLYPHPLGHAARTGQIQAARILLEHGAKVDSDGGYPPLVGAARNGQVEMIHLLCDHGADVRGSVGRDALSKAVGWDQPLCVRALLERGANPNDENRMRPLIISAMRYGYDDVVDTLIEFGADTVNPGKGKYAEEFANCEYPLRRKWLAFP